MLSCNCIICSSHEYCSFQVRPQWAYGKDDAWEALVSKWLGHDPAFNALSTRNKAYRGHGGTHCAGAHNHDRHKAKLVYIYAWTNLHLFPLIFLPDMHNTSLVMQEATTGRPHTPLQTWEDMKKKKKKTDPSKPQEYCGNAKDALDRYIAVAQDLAPEVDDPLAHDTDPRAQVLAGHGLEHGRFILLNAVTPRTPETSLTRVKATLTADDPPVMPRRQPSQPRPDVSISQFHPLSDILFLSA